MTTETIHESITLDIETDIKWKPDDSPDLSHLGVYSNHLEKGGIDRKERGDMGRHEYRYFNPGCGSPEYIESDYERMESYNRGNWWMEGCIVTVRYRQLSASSSLWGIESDSDDSYKREVESDLRSNAIEELKNKINARLEVE